ncbi:Ig-like domain-containing protein, partial [Shewanella sp. SR41-2]|nr:Ig-like domain-containing protein [Shewanella sp. SR41-2]
MNHSIKKTYLVFTMLLGFILLAGCNGDNNNDNSNNDNNGVLLTSIAVTPATPSMPLGLKQQFTAMGTYSDGTSSDITNSATWSSDDSTVATINASGLAMGVIPGSVAITASLIDSSSNEQSATTTLTITDATLTALAITPVTPSLAKGLTKQFMATGTYSDGTSPDVTTSVTWSSANTLVATVNASGLASGVAIGSSVITASLGSDETTTELNITDAILSSIALTPVEPSIAKGITQQFTAIGTYSDGISVDITASANWSSADTLVATMNTSGAAKGVSIGSSIITADFQAQSATSLLTVTDASLTSIML